MVQKYQLFRINFKIIYLCLNLINNPNKGIGQIQTNEILKTSTNTLKLN